ncbi:malate synthase G [Salicibibacter halophilus]|uniref:Malate synthase G n=1 Tax=Salicibibacter halophilus TaxID=2502791 RepID=A0A514LGX8_9BACI|nr:malate synthase G [Salicibibacter halophilus]QDI91100.1 malate synthase G [Salicibibacter halophilus]
MSEKIGNLTVEASLYEFINQEALVDSGLTAEQFWADFERLIRDFSGRNKKLLKKREEIQEKIDQWNRDNQDDYFQEAYEAFLKEIGYLEKEVDDFEITTENVDPEITAQPGPQLVVPVKNGRYALNAANARWGSLYDALYGSDIIPEKDGAEQGTSYNPVRGDKVVAYAKRWLDEAIPLTEGSHKDAKQYKVENGILYVDIGGKSVTLQNAKQFLGTQGEKGDSPAAMLFKNHGLYFEIQIDANHPIGKTDEAHVKDVYVESAITTIIDCEDSVAAVDAEDKVDVYRNWLGLMNGTLTKTFTKGNQTITRKLHPDRTYSSPFGESFTLPGRSLMFNRNVGHLMTSDAILDENGQPVPEGILDAVVTSLAAKQDVLGNGNFQNSAEGSIYIVKPKMHGSEEVAFTNDLFDRVEDMLGLKRHTIKVGVMDEERRTSLNLKNCIYEARERIIFINTGFLDRTGDEIHTSMELGPMIRKNEMKASTWLQAYEDSNVNVGVNSGFRGKAQIGKGMWAMPKLMKDMMDKKDGQLKAGANTAWVPSPTAATLHALHYHDVDVFKVQQAITQGEYRDEMLELPIDATRQWSEKEIQQELDNNAQGILGYVVRWIDQGVGSSSVPDIDNVDLMEDRATLRISSQHMTNWLHHGICSEEQVLETLKRMAKVVDEQNAGDPNYTPMAPDYDNSVAFQAGCDLVFKGKEQPNGYTEPILHRRRQEAKAKMVAR